MKWIGGGGGGFGGGVGVGVLSRFVGLRGGVGRRMVVALVLGLGESRQMLWTWFLSTPESERC